MLSPMLEKNKNRNKKLQNACYILCLVGWAIIIFVITAPSHIKQETLSKYFFIEKDTVINPIMWAVYILVAVTSVCIVFLYGKRKEMEAYERGLEDGMKRQEVVK